MLPDRSILIGQILVENAKLKNSNETFLVIFKHCEQKERREVISDERTCLAILRKIMASPIQRSCRAAAASQTSLGWVSK